MKTFLIAAGAFLIAMSATAASAAKFDFSMSFAQSNDLSTIYSAAGTFDATLLSLSGPGNVIERYEVNSATGSLTNNYNPTVGTIDGVQPFDVIPEFTLNHGGFVSASLVLTAANSGWFYLFESAGQPVAGYGEAFGTPVVSITAAAAVPEPATWAMLLAGFGFAGVALRGRRGGMAIVSA